MANQLYWQPKNPALQGSAFSNPFIRWIQIVGQYLGWYANEITFANVTATPFIGQLYNISDSDTAVPGDIVAGGGTFHVLIRWTGAAWAVVGGSAGGGSGTIVGAIADKQVAFGTAANVIGGDTDLEWDNPQLTVVGGISAQGGGSASFGGSPAALVVDTDTGSNWQFVITDPGAPDPYVIVSFNGGAVSFLSANFATTGSSTTYGPNGILSESNARGTGAIPGKVLSAGRNTSGAGAAGSLGLINKGGTYRYIWQDAANALRVGAAQPTEDASVSDTSGTLIALVGGNIGAATGISLGLTSYLRVGTVAFAGLPGTPTVGDLMNVSNSNTAVWGAAIAGGGANNVLARWNGANWTVVGA